MTGISMKYKNWTNHFCSSLATHASFHECVASNNMITWTNKNKPAPNFDRVPANRWFYNSQLHVFLSEKEANFKESQVDLEEAGGIGK